MSIDVHSVFVALMWLLGVIAADLAFGVWDAVKNKVFSWDKLSQFAITNLPKVFVWLLFVGLSAMPADLIPKEYSSIVGSVGNAVYAFLMASFVGSLLVHAKNLGALSDKFWDSIGVRTGSSKG